MSTPMDIDEALNMISIGMSGNIPSGVRIELRGIEQAKAELNRIIAAKQEKSFRDAAKLVYEADTMQQAIDNIELEADKLQAQATGVET